MLSPALPLSIQPQLLLAFQSSKDLPGSPGWIPTHSLRRLPHFPQTHPLGHLLEDQLCANGFHCLFLALHKDLTTLFPSLPCGHSPTEDTGICSALQQSSLEPSLLHASPQHHSSVHPQSHRRLHNRSLMRGRGKRKLASL